MPRKRYITEFVVHDDALTSVSPLAQLAYFRMLSVSDDFGFVPGSITVLKTLCGFLEFLRKWPSIASELISAGLVNPLIHNGQSFYFFNPESFDRIQNHIVAKRTQSEYLHLQADKIVPLRIPPCDKENIFQEILRMDGASVSKKFLPSRARQASSLSLPLSPRTEKSKEKDQLTADVPVPPVETSSLIPHPSSLAEDIPTEIVHIMQRIGEAINCDPYRWVTVLKWTAPLKGAASEFGWACLLHQALRFETWIVGEHQSGKLKHGARANPLARFLNIWMRGNFPDGRPHVPLSERTAPDTVTDWPPELLPSHSPHFQINIERE